MRTNRCLVRSLIAAVALVMPSFADAQKPLQILNVEQAESIPAIAGAPFTADASTEFTQILSDGNRIEQRFTASLARDGRGRTRSEQEVAMLGPLVVLQKGASSKLSVITDPTEGTTYTLDDRRKEARRSPMGRPVMKVAFQALDLKKGRAAEASREVVESLGTRQIEGVKAEGVRSTTTIPAGEIGNLNPIHLVTERWFSKELQMPVLITRRDPRSGETVYRLMNIVRAEPAPDVLAVPSDYRVVDQKKARADDMRIELKKLEKLVELERTVAQP